MLIYHPVYDLNHSLFRALMILEISEHKEISLDLFRIIDFYTIFPHLIKEIRPFPNELRAYRKVLNEIPDSYERIGNIKRIMFELEGVQTTALQNLLAKDLIDYQAFKSKLISRTGIALSENLNQSIKESNTAQEEWFLMLVNEFCGLKLKGSSGLKSRSGLMEYRYDMESS